MVVKMEMESHPTGIEEPPEAAVPMEIESSGDQNATTNTNTTTTTTGRLRRKASSRPKLHPTVAVIKMERDPIEEAEAIIAVEIVSSGDQSAIEEPEPEAIIPNETLSSGTGRLRRKVASRTESWYPQPLPPPRRGTRKRELPTYFTSLSPPQAEDIPARARKKRRLEEPLPTKRVRTRATTTDEDARKTASPDVADDTGEENANAESVSDTQPNSVATRATGHWTPDEDAKLTSAVANTSMKKHKTDWVAVAAQVPGRTRGQCRDRWKLVLDPSIDRTPPGHTGQWVEDEDIKLKDAVQRHGVKNWVAISALVPGRTKKQCRYRWHVVINCGIDRANGHTGKWTPDEDIKLKDAVRTYGGKNWVLIAELVPGRTNLQCRKRWRILP
jgi:hypothetical protein